MSISLSLLSSSPSSSTDCPGWLGGKRRRRREEKGRNLDTMGVGRNVARERKSEILKWNAFYSVFLFFSFLLFPSWPELAPRSVKIGYFHFAFFENKKRKKRKKLLRPTF